MPSTVDVVSAASGVQVAGSPIAHDTMVVSVGKLGKPMAIDRTRNKVVQPFGTGELQAKYTNRYDEPLYYSS
jgi:hypothetical protein